MVKSNILSSSSRQANLSQIAAFSRSFVHSTHQPSDMPIQSVVDAYFFEEIQSCMGHQMAHAWLSAHNQTVQSQRSHQLDSCKAHSGPSTAVGAEQDDRSTLTAALPGPVCEMDWEDKLDLVDLAAKMGVGRGLLFTDAAHILLDSSCAQRSPAKAVSC